jgi:hypothetical protein
MSKRRGGGRLHAVEVSRRATDSSWNPVASEVLIRRICVRYEDGRKVCFVPEAGEEFFSRDDVHRVVGMLHKGSETLEWTRRQRETQTRRDTRARGRSTPAPSDFWGCLILALVGLPGQRGKEP